ncbi:hypothetical protein [Gloeothece verrucosa]|uniref:Uncharacterized protein n=1 Tax=Gloeothece verrucosa (strain PCC 7822) TaxID=497965 RepID=E0UN09_GLOV7|nr:hypothetical protein [Gloeothece verrucosa]ADN18339.1 hypothetical protein Cyan7822_6581 [Gloeothece verrucosa PCC 7822]
MLEEFPTRADLEQEILRLRAKLLGQEKLALIGSLTPAIAHDLLNDYEVIFKKLSVAEIVLNRLGNEKYDLGEQKQLIQKRLTNISEILSESSQMIHRYFFEVLSENRDKHLQQEIDVNKLVNESHKHGSYRFDIQSPQGFTRNVIRDYQENIFLVGNEFELRYVFISNSHFGKNKNFSFVLKLKK